MFRKGLVFAPHRPDVGWRSGWERSCSHRIARMWVAGGGALVFAPHRPDVGGGSPPPHVDALVFAPHRPDVGGGGVGVLVFAPHRPDVGGLGRGSSSHRIARCGCGGWGARLRTASPRCGCRWGWERSSSHRIAQTSVRGRLHAGMQSRPPAAHGRVSESALVGGSA